MQVVEKEPRRKNLKAGAGRVIAGVQNDITIPFFNDVFYNQDPTLLARGHGKGLKLYEEIERDTFAFSVLQKRKTTLTERNWDVVPGGETERDKQAADFVRAQFKRLPFDRIREDLLDSTLKGFAVSEIIWARQDDYFIPAQIITQEQRRFTFDKDWKPRLLTYKDTYKGEQLPDRKFLVHRFGVKGNNPFGLGHGTRLFFPVMFKREGVAFWLKFLEKFASPTVVGKTPYGTLEAEQSKLLQTLNRIHSDGAIAMPVDVNVELLEAKRTGSMNAQEWVNYWDKQMSIAVLGETLTTDLGAVGSRAAAEVHSGVLDKLVNRDADLLADMLEEQLIAWMIDYNFPGAAIPKLVHDRPRNEKEEAETDKAKAEASIAENDALRAKIAFISNIDNDDVARSILTTSGLVDTAEAAVVDELVNSRAQFKAVTPSAAIGGAAEKVEEPAEEAAFAAFKKKR